MHTNIKKENLEKAFKHCWSDLTCYPGQKDQWSKENSALGQCAVTSVIVQDYYGGKIGYNSKYHHYWNILENNEIIDFTKVQFGNIGVISLESIIERDYILYSDRAYKVGTLIRYNILKNCIQNYLNKY
jgi:hypothetical protein